MVRHLTSVLLGVFLMVSCRPHQKEVIHFPKDFPAPRLNPNNPVSAAGIKLGKQLFYDPQLSASGKVSCATCHQPARAFTDGVPTPKLSGHERLLRNTPSLYNLAWSTAFFWEGGGKNLESAIMGPMLHQQEMGGEMQEVSERLSQDECYNGQFEEVFGKPVIHPQWVAKALAQYLYSLIADSSRYDAVQRGQATYTALEEQGAQLFAQHCARCHPAPLFTDNQYHAIGLSIDIQNDTLENILKGRYRVSYQAKDLGAFKTPGLRNVALTAPYMHDGRYATLKEVIQHYSRLDTTNFPVDSLLQKDMATTKWNSAKTEALLAFLHTLTEEKFIR